MLARGATLGFRVQEPDWAECYFCDGRGVEDSREHIVPRWLQTSLGMIGQEFEPQYFAGVDTRGGRDLPKPTHDRGPIPAASLVTKGICLGCNNGWMSVLESDFKGFLPSMTDVPLEVVAKWFIKTAIVLNVSQNTRLLVPREVRLELAAGRINQRVSLYFHKVSSLENSDVSFNWAQGAQMPYLSFDGGLDAPRRAHLEESHRTLWACSVRVGPLVATTIIAPPGESWTSAWEAPGAQAVAAGVVKPSLDWDRLPVLTHFSHGVCLVPISTRWLNSFMRPVEVLPWPDGVEGLLELRQALSLLEMTLGYNDQAATWGGAGGAALDLK